MGCGTSKSIDIEDSSTKKQTLVKSELSNGSHGNEIIIPEDFVQEKSIELFSTRSSKQVECLSSDSESNSVFQRSLSIARETTSDTVRTSQNGNCHREHRKSELSLQQRIEILKIKRDSKNELEANGTATPNGISNGSIDSQTDYLTNESVNLPNKVQSESPITRPKSNYTGFSSPRQQECNLLSPRSSPFGQRRLQLTDSQKEFFLMLDEKIAQGKDYCSEDERSISSLVSRQSTGRFSRSYPLQHVR